MNDRDMITVIAERAGLTQEKARAALRVIAATIPRDVASGPVHLDGFGSFTKHVTGPKRASTPYTPGIPGTLMFKPAKSLHAMFNPETDDH
ncbi:hypothetical protein AMK16_27125 [Streptomyces sp. CB00455]|uniref:HU family DNA-binding protein n=1 Tax=Streptomyces sp. CB00455 TaxID=1703927 RepID=UPI00093FF53E|nr:HU family DNA-binding protein [Streptomyces sp. CB00455]OKK15595.1 hypothetical protein AMK16_27125 [Streptomyces sp. CB00455]